MKFFFNNPRMKRRRERGAALLFAIGILAMLMMLGLGFVTNALIANRIASNNSRRSQARSIARAAVAQAMTQIMLYVDQANNPNNIADDSARTLYDFGAIRSTGDTVAVNQASSQTSETDLNDQLTGAATKLQFTYDPGYNVSGQRYDFSAAAASWVFFYDDAADSNKRIIGRAAWQVLPRHMRAGGTPEIDDASRLSLFKILAGAVGAPANDDDAESPPSDSRDVLLNERNRIPWRHRWGRGVEEMHLDLTGSPFAGWIANGDNAAEAPPYTFDMLFSAYYDYFSTAPVTARAWIRKWFSEGDQRLAKEAFAAESGGNITYYHRFNLGDNTDGDLAWYDRFPSGVMQNLGAGANNVLDDLAAPSRVYRERDVLDDKTNYYSGLPFLTRIGNDSGSFNTIENFRKQIAANLNDYCDEDDVPTSDRAASTWDVTDSSTYPGYTGNEKTLYINEAALKLSEITATFSANPNLTIADSEKNRGKVEITSVTPTLIAELVNIYDNTAAPATLNPANYSFSTALKSLSFQIALKVEFDVDFNYTSGNPAVPTSASTTATVEYTDNAVAKINFTAAAPAKKTISAFANPASGYSGYFVGTVALDPIVAASITQPDPDILASRITAAATGGVPPGGTFTELTSVKVKTIGYKLQIGSGSDPASTVEFYPFLLKASGNAVDFVRMERAGAMTLKGSPEANPDESVSSLTTHTFAAAGIIGGFEARDPRQNLNPNSTDPAKSDWDLVPTIANLVVGTAETPTQQACCSLAFGPTAVVGRRNRSANPKVPTYYDAEGSSVTIDNRTIDLETATDPAWRGTAAGEHISTAVIRNAPMKSLWELGAIHRARPWQTLNLTGASNFVASGATPGNISASDMVMSNFSANGDPKWDNSDGSNLTRGDGTDYTQGDGGILDMVKLSNACRAWGKLDFTLLTQTKITADNSAFSGMDALDEALVKALFYKIRSGQTLQDFITASSTDSGSAATGTKIGNVGNAVVDSFIHDTGVVSTSNGTGKFPSAKLRSELLNTNYGESGNTCGLTATAANDAAQEEIIGKTIGLLSANGRTIPNVFKVLVIAQSIDDIGGFGVDIPVVKKDSGGNSRTVNCRQGVFNYCSAADQSGNSYNLYFDRITGEVKLLATIERDPETGNMKIRQLEYLD